MIREIEGEYIILRGKLQYERAELLYLRNRECFPLDYTAKPYPTIFIPTDKEKALDHSALIAWIRTGRATQKVTVLFILRLFFNRTIQGDAYIHAYNRLYGQSLADWRKELQAYIRDNTGYGYDRYVPFYRAILIMSRPNKQEER